MHRQNSNYKMQDASSWDKINITGGALSKNEVQVQHSCQNYYGWVEHHKLANTTLDGLQSIANATVRGTAD